MVNDERSRLLWMSMHDLGWPLLRQCYFTSENLKNENRTGAENSNFSSASVCAIVYCNSAIRILNNQTKGGP